MKRGKRKSYAIQERKKRVKQHGEKGWEEGSKGNGVRKEYWKGEEEGKTGRWRKKRMESNRKVRRMG